MCSDAVCVDVLSTNAVCSEEMCPGGTRGTMVVIMVDQAYQHMLSLDTILV